MIRRRGSINGSARARGKRASQQRPLQRRPTRTSIAVPIPATGSPTTRRTLRSTRELSTCSASTLLAQQRIEAFCCPSSRAHDGQSSHARRPLRAFSLQFSGEIKGSEVQNFRTVHTFSFPANAARGTAASRVRIACRARLSRDITVPTGTDKISAISPHVNLPPRPAAAPSDVPKGKASSARETSIASSRAGNPALRLGRQRNQIGNPPQLPALRIKCVEQDAKQPRPGVGASAATDESFATPAEGTPAPGLPPDEPDVNRRATRSKLRAWHMATRSNSSLSREAQITLADARGRAAHSPKVSAGEA